jgi:hypothetical protein
MFCAPGLVFDGTGCDVFRFHVLRSRTRFRRYGGRWVPFSSVSRLSSPDFMFSTAPGVAVPFFIFCAPGLVFDGTGCDVFRFHVLRSLTRFRRYGGRWVPFSCFACPNSFSTVPRVLGPVFMFCTPRVVSRGTEGVSFRFYILRVRTYFWRCGGRRVPFSCFALPDTFSAVLRVSGPVFMF